MAQNKDEIKEYLDSMMKQEGAYGYVLISYDGIPVKLFPEPDEEGKSEIDSVQYAALFADLVKKTQLTLSYLYTDPAGQQFQSLRLRTKEDNEYILVAIQNCKFSLDDEEEEGEEKE